MNSANSENRTSLAMRGIAAGTGGAFAASDIDLSDNSLPHPCRSVWGRDHLAYELMP
jgi:hypothetical protein